MAFCVYIVTNKRNGTLYIGHTEDLPIRMWQHKNKTFKGFTAQYDCDRLVWYAEFTTRIEAKTRERQMKACKRACKIELIDRDNPDWTDLTEALGHSMR